MRATRKLVTTAPIAGCLVSLQVTGTELSTREQCDARFSDACDSVNRPKFVSQRPFRDGTRSQPCVSHVDPDIDYHSVKLLTGWQGRENYRVDSSAANEMPVAEVEQGYGYAQNRAVAEIPGPAKWVNAYREL